MERERTRRQSNIVQLLNDKNNLNILPTNIEQSSVIDVDSLYPTDGTVSEITGKYTPWTNRNPEELLQKTNRFRPLKTSDQVSVWKVQTSTVGVKLHNTSPGALEKCVTVGDE